jgi:hypothetical protein
MVFGEGGICTKKAW